MRRFALPGLLLAFLLMAVVPRALAAPEPATIQLLGTEPHDQRVSLTMPDGRSFSATPGWFRSG
jgi:hypothetical protein